MSDSNRNHTIDVLKGIAIIMVVITHYEWTLDQRKYFVFPYIINMAIPIFMVITGYVYSISLKGINHLEDAFVWRKLLQRSLRYTLPVIAVICWELCDTNFTITTDSLERLRWAINGTFGKGNYYYPVMMQLLFLFPLIYFVIDKKKTKGLLVSFIANLLYEILSWAYCIPSNSYRVLMFRYLFLIAVGVYAYKGYKLSRFANVILTTIGFGYITLVAYLGYEPKILNVDWVATNLISSLLIVPFMVFVLQNIRIQFLPLEILGRASYHIFLVQMIYYAGYYTIIQEKSTTWIAHLIAGIVISLGLGVAFYYIDKPIQNLIRKTLLVNDSQK